RTPRQQTAHLAAEARPRQRGPRRPRAGRSRIVRVVELYRVFEWDGTSLGRTDGGPLYVARTLQGPGRHDNPSQFAAWYCSRDPASAVAESIQRFRGQMLEDLDFVRPNGRMNALVGLDADDDLSLVDLDDPAELSARDLRPSRVATPRRTAT